MPYFDTHDNTRLAYEDYGTGQALVFCASVSLGADMWEYQVPFLVEQGFRCVLLDRRGHGRSDRPSTGYDLDTLADDLGALLEHLDLTDVVLVGHSAGGAEIARYLARHGEDRVRKVAFIASVLPFMLLTDDNPAGIPQGVCDIQLADLRRDRPKWFSDRAQGFFATHLGNDVSPAMIETALQQCLSTAPIASAQVFKEMFTEDHRETLRNMSVPALVVHGAADQSVPIEVSAPHAAKLLADCVYKEYPTAGHGLYFTHADQLNNDLLEFVKA